MDEDQIVPFPDCLFNWERNKAVLSKKREGVNIQNVYSTFLTHVFHSCLLITCFEGCTWAQCTCICLRSCIIAIEVLSSKLQSASMPLYTATKRLFGTSLSSWEDLFSSVRAILANGRVVTNPSASEPVRGTN